MFTKALWTLSSSLASSSGSASKCSQDQIDCLTSSSPICVKSVSSKTLASSFGNKPSEESEADLEEGRVDLICVSIMSSHLRHWEVNLAAAWRRQRYMRTRVALCIVSVRPNVLNIWSVSSVFTTTKSRRIARHGNPFQSVQFTCVFSFKQSTFFQMQMMSNVGKDVVWCRG